MINEPKDWKALCYESDIEGMRWKERAVALSACLHRLHDSADDFRDAVRDEDAVRGEVSRNERLACQRALGDVLDETLETLARSGV
jgi:hypothetical protein